MLGSRHIIFLLGWICWGGLNLGNAQVTWQGGFHTGTVLKINPIFPELTRSSSIYELGIQIPTKGKDPWHARHGFPQIGVSAFYYDLGNPEVFGHAYSVLPHLIFLWSKPDAKWKVHFSVGTSYAYIDRKFDRQTNPTNNVIGANVNSFSIMQIKLSRNIKDRWMPYIGGSFSHFSNANVKVPNLGINIPAINVGLAYAPSGTVTPPVSCPDTTHFRWSPGVKIGLGLTSSKVPNGPLFPVYVADAWMNFHWRSKLRLRAGTTWFFSESAYTFIKETEAPLDDEEWGATGGAIFVGSEFLLGHISFIAQLGPYLKKPYSQPYFLYTKMGLQFYLQDQQVHRKNQLFFGMYVHSHSGEADFGEWAIGFVF